MAEGVGARGEPARDRDVDRRFLPGAARRQAAGPAVAQVEGVDLFIGSPTVWGLGVQLEPDGSWGMGGLGGNAGWADPARGRAIAYVTRRLGDFGAVDRIESALAVAESS